MSTEHHNNTSKEKFFHNNGDVGLLGKGKKKLIYTHYSEKHFLDMNYQQQLPRKVSETSLFWKKIVLSETITFSYVYLKAN